MSGTRKAGFVVFWTFVLLFTAVCPMSFGAQVAPSKSEYSCHAPAVRKTALQLGAPRTCCGTHDAAQSPEHASFEFTAVSHDGVCAMPLTVEAKRSSVLTAAPDTSPPRMMSPLRI